MATREENIILEPTLRRVLAFGLMISAISIVMSVTYLWENHRYLEFAIATVIFIGICITIRWLNFA